VEGLERDPLFVALTRPQMLAGVTYSYLVANAVLATELFLIFRSAWVLAIAVGLHVAGVLLSVRDARFFDLWITRIASCPRVRNHSLWRCNSYSA
jgi:type IV secretion system protein VirB3